MERFFKKGKKNAASADPGPPACPVAFFFLADPEMFGHGPLQDHIGSRNLVPSYLQLGNGQLGRRWPRQAGTLTTTQCFWKLWARLGIFALLDFRATCGPIVPCWRLRL